jgi:hypothetical protein
MMREKIEVKQEEHLYTSDQKIKWCGYGEWVEEPDRIEFEYLGYKAVVNRAFVKETYGQKEAYFGGHLCGYVRIPEDHHLFSNEEISVNCHYGLTFNKKDEEHWVGFDCAHAGDYVPTMELFKKISQANGKFEPFPVPEEFKQCAIFNPIYRNIEYCIEICMEMIDQIIDIQIGAKLKNE